MPGEEKPSREPSTWELMRGFERVEKRLDDMSRDFVSAVVHNLLADRVKELEAEVAAGKADAAHAVDKAKAEAATALAAVRTELDNAKKTRAQTWTAIGLLFVGGGVSLFYVVVSNGLGIS